MTCECGRPRASGIDIERWFDETDRVVDGRETSYRPGLGVQDDLPLDRIDSGGFARSFVMPLWAPALCWTPLGAPCRRRRQWATDRWIGAARMAFRFYAEHGVSLAVRDPVPSDGFYAGDPRSVSPCQRLWER
jgi:hypothetical protein